MKTQLNLQLEKAVTTSHALERLNERLSIIYHRAWIQQLQTKTTAKNDENEADTVWELIFPSRHEEPRIFKNKARRGPGDFPL